MSSNKGHQAPERRIRRAAAACYRCHWRKVRCDAAVLGYPCTNCTLDGITGCTLRPNATSRFKRLQDSDKASTPQSLGVSDGPSHFNPSVSTEYNSNSTTSTAALQNPSECWDHNDAETPRRLDLGVPAPGAPMIGTASFTIENTGTAFLGQSFVDLGRLSSLPMNEVQILMVNGCLEIPPKAAVDMFVRKYFLLVHTLVPIIDEAQFWGVYTQTKEFPSYQAKLSLFVFQAMLLASCAFVPVEYIQQCGFQNIHDARRALYHRAKVLYDTGFESDPLARAQGALLLTFHTTAEDPQATMTWNICAIQNAMAVAAVPNVLDPHAAIAANKRLWWSVFVRDRILWLGRHRRPQFISANFNVAMNYLEESDVADEIVSSRVYTADSKRVLLKLFQAQCRLAVILTDVNAIAFSASEAYSPRLSIEGLHSSLALVQALKSRLAQWREVRMPLTQTDSSEQEPINILTNIMLMHYENARIALAHHETFLVEQHLGLIRDRSSTLLLGIAKELKESMSNVTQNLSYFASANLTENIPLSVLASSGTPMVLSAIDVKLSSSQSEKLDRRRTLDDCAKIIKQAGKVYDVTDFFSQGTNHILQLAYAITKNLFIDDTTQKSDASASQHGNEAGEARAIVPAFNGLRVKGWVEAFLKYPRAYLVISSCIDHSLATGRLPRDELLPPLIRGSVYTILGLPKLPWTITAPTHPNHDHAGRYIEEGQQDQDRSASVSLVDQRNPSLDDPWYWSLIHNVTSGPQSAFDADAWSAGGDSVPFALQH